MRTFSKLNESKTTKKIKVTDETINYLSVEQLKDYLKKVNNFIMDETKNIIQYLIVNNTAYISELSTDDEENAIVGFYNTGKPSGESQKQLYEWISKVVQEDRELEIPTLLTKKQFDDIIESKVAPDYIYYKMDTEAGQNLVAQKYMPMIKKIAAQFVGQSNLSMEDLESCGHEALTYAIQHYGKSSAKTKVEDIKVKEYTFLSYCAYMIRNIMLEEIKHNSRTIRISVSAQKRAKETGGILPSTVSGDKVVGHDDEGKSKTLFDFISAAEETNYGSDKNDVERLWAEIYELLEKKFDKTRMEVWYSFYGLNGRQEVKNKDLSKKYGISASNITYYVTKVNEYIKSNKVIQDKMKEISAIMAESQSIRDRNNLEAGEIYETFN